MKASTFKKMFAASIAGLLAFSISVCLPAYGADYPNKAVRIVVPLAAGGPADTIARTVGEYLSRLWKQAVIVENRPGASGIIGAELVLRSPPDGYVVLLAITSHIQMIGLSQKLPFDPINDFSAVTQLGLARQVFMVQQEGPRSLSDLVARAKSDPASVSYASFGHATTGHIYGEMLNRAAGIRAANVSYNGGAPAVAALLGGQVTASFVEITQARTQMRAGRLRAIAITGDGRSTLLPEVPSFGELGYPGFEILGWHGVVAPKGTPREVLAKLQSDIRHALSDPAISAKFADLGLEVVGNTPEEFDKVLRIDAEKWLKIIRDIGLEAR